MEKEKIWMKRWGLLGALLAAGCLLFAACGEEPVVPPQTYAITAENSADCTLEAPASAEAGQTVTVTAEVRSELKEVSGVFFNGAACTPAGEGTFTFVMPAEAVTLTASAQFVQTEILSDDVLYWDAASPGQIARAREEDASWAGDLFCFRFAEARNLQPSEITVTSLNPEVIPDEAIGDLSLHSVNMGSMRDYGTFRVSLGKVSPGTAYLAVQAKSSSVTRIDAVVIKKVQVVEYGQIVQETWNETVNVDLSQVFDRYQGITVQIYDADAPYSADDFGVTEIADREMMTLTLAYVPGHRYSFSVYYLDKAGKAVFLDLPGEVYGEGSETTGFAHYKSPFLTFALPDTSITIAATD